MKVVEGMSYVRMRSVKNRNKINSYDMLLIDY